MSSPNQRVHVIIASHSNGEWLEVCLAAVFGQAHEDVQVTMLEDLGAGAGTLLGQLMQRYPDIKRLPIPTGMGLAAATNRAAALVRDAKFILLLDPEAVLALDALERLRAAFAARPTAAVIGCKVLGGDVETIHHIGLRLRGNGLPTAIGQGELDRGQYRGLQEALTLQAGALLIRAEAWCELGGLDERFEYGFYDRLDFCVRCWQANWTITIAGDATSTHFGLADGQIYHPEEKEQFFLSRARFLQKHYRAKDWFTRWLPDELRWWKGHDAETVSPTGTRMLALRALYKAWRTPPPAPPPINMRGGHVA